MNLDQDIVLRLATPADQALFEGIAPDVFDNAIRQEQLLENLHDARHHLAIAISGGLIIGMAVGIHYTQPDKDHQFFVDELGVSPAYQRRGVGRGLLQLLLSHAKSLGCLEAWVSTEEDNIPARALYSSVSGSQESRAVIYTFPLS